MAEQLLTREFSICLLPTDDVTEDVQALREALPASPYRDDIPHITLLRGITSATELSDTELAEDIERMLSITDALPLTGQCRAVVNASNQFYSSSSAVLLDASPELLAYRQKVANQLTAHGYDIEAQELATYTPHVAIRLGVPLEGDLMHQAEQLFVNRVFSFNRWLLFRLVTEGDRRLMHQVWPL